ncbi:unnamed protein product [Linum tenue]|uniref:Uncharacterized protein n=1 Tax=Linum tenue TaxID=586396 RepID=A0AAV0RXD2_9ROSI|nr:unnamed protein product [Linum tenue]
MKISSSSGIVVVLLLIYLLPGNEVVAFRRHESRDAGHFCYKFTSFPAASLHFRGGVCKDSICESACRNKFGRIGVVIYGRYENLSCGCYTACKHLYDPPRPDLKLN